MCDFVVCINTELISSYWMPIPSTLKIVIIILFVMFNLWFFRFMGLMKND